MRDLALLVTVTVTSDGAKRPGFEGGTYFAVTEILPKILAPVLEKHGARATYLCSSDVLAHDPSMSVLTRYGNAEIGTHLLSELCAPGVASWNVSEVLASQRQFDLSASLEFEKLAVLTALYRQQLGRSPVSFRAGLFGVGQKTGGLLALLGYRVDSSVTPHECWTRGDGHSVLNFRDVPESPYAAGADGNLLIAGDSDLLEVPVTITREASGATQWLDPIRSSPETLARIVRNVAAEPVSQTRRRPLNVHIDLRDFLPDYTQDRDPAAKMSRAIAGLDALLRTASECQAIPLTLSDYQQSSAAFPVTPTSSRSEQQLAARERIVANRALHRLDTRPRVKIIADVPNWIFERHARTLQRLLVDDFRIDIGFHTETTNEDAYDLIYPLEFTLYPLNAIRRPEKFITGIRSHVSWDRIQPEVLGTVLRQRFAATHVVSRRLFEVFAPHVPNLAVLAHGVEAERFAPSSVRMPASPNLSVGWAGNRKTATKNFDTLIAPIDALPGVELVFCGYSDRNLSLDEMREWYDRLDVFVHASGSEGHNNALVEAAMMGRAIVTTDAGTVPEWLVDGEHALIVDRDASAIRHAVLTLREDLALRRRLGAAARKQAVSLWDWKHRVDDYRSFFTAALDRRPAELARLATAV